MQSTCQQVESIHGVHTMHDEFPSGQTTTSASTLEAL